MTTAHALVLEGPRRLVRRTFDVPEVTEDGAVVRVEACGLCGTDHEQFTGALPGGLPFVPGHETVGILENVGSRAADRLGVVSGDRVAIEVFQSCRTCDTCLNGEYRRCASHGIGDMYGFIPASRPPGLWGGYAHYQYLTSDTMLHKVPEGLDPVLATLFNPLGAGIRWGVTVPMTSEGTVVAVLGPGIRGLSACAAAKSAGAGFVLVTGKGRRDAARLSLATRFGADLAIDVEDDAPDVALRRATGGLADVVVDVTAKAPEAMGQAVALARPGGTVVLAGTRGTAPLRGFDPDLVVYKELRLLGALGVDAPAYRAALAMLGEGVYPFEELPRALGSLADAGDLLGTMGGEGTVPPVHAVIVPWG